MNASILPKLISLECAGLVRTRGIEGGWKVGRPEGHAIKTICVMQHDGNWFDFDRKKSVKGRGILSMARHLGFGLEVMEYL